MPVNVGVNRAAVLAGANPMTGLYAFLTGPVAGGFLESTTVVVVVTTSAAAVTSAEVMNAGPADPIRTLAPPTVLIAIVVPTLVLKITGADVANVASASGPIEVGLPSRPTGRCRQGERGSSPPDEDVAR